MSTDALSLAESALAKAENDLEKLEALVDSLSTDVEILSEKKNYLEKQSGELAVDVTLGIVSSDEVNLLKRDLGATSAELAEKQTTLTAANRRVDVARKDVKRCTEAVRDAQRRWGQPLLARLSNDAREAWRKAFAAEALLLAVGESINGSENWMSHNFRMLGNEGSPSSLPEVAKREGIQVESLGLRPARPLPRLTREALRKLSEESSP